MVDKKLDSYMANYTGFNDWLIRRRYEHLSQYFTGMSCLELGSAEGSGTPYLLESFDEVTIVDGSKDAVDMVVNKLDSPKLTAICSYFEDMDFQGKKFDTIILAHILEHVDNPDNVLRIAKNLANKEGVIIIDVPNGDSLHRQVGVKLGLLKKNTELNDADLSIGHQRVYVPETFKKQIKQAGLDLEVFGGMFIKLTSNSQTEQIFNSNQLEAQFRVGTDNPEIAAEIYAICKI